MVVSRISFLSMNQCARRTGSAGHLDYVQDASVLTKTQGGTIELDLEIHISSFGSLLRTREYKWQDLLKHNPHVLKPQVEGAQTVKRILRPHR